MPSFGEAVKAGYRPELEKPGVLPNRRPADIMIHTVGPDRTHFSDIALDFAVISPLTAQRLRQPAEVLGGARAYAEQKRTFQSTAARCAEANVGFEPVIFESAGGLDDAGRKVFETMCADVAQRTEGSKHDVLQRVKTRISIDLQRAAHRSLQKRAAHTEHDVMIQDRWGAVTPPTGTWAGPDIS